jgi:hypothetical protein
VFGDLGPPNRISCSLQSFWGTSDGSSSAFDCAESDVEFTFTFHTYFVGEVDFEEESCFSILSSLYSLVTESLSVGGRTSLS